MKDESSFQKAVKAFILDAGLIGINAAADYFTAAPASIKRWAEGMSAPRKAMEKEVLAWINRYRQWQNRYGGKLHVYSQFIQHDDIFIVGDKTALTKLRAAIDRALINSESIFSASTNDGEGFDAIIVCGDMKAEIMRPYTNTEAKDRRKEAIAPNMLCAYKKLKTGKENK